MKTYTLHRRQLIDRTVDEVFNFFKQPENLARITPQRLNFKILTPQPIAMQQGTLIDYTIRLMGLPVRWTTQITEFQPPHHFADIQLKGPYAYWLHTHSFRAVKEGTLMEDEVVYVLPMGWIGRWMHGLYVKKQLDQIFDYRAEMIRGIFSLNKGILQ